MTLDEKIGQLFVIPLAPYMGQEHKEEVFSLMHRYHISNVIYKAKRFEERDWLEELDPNTLVCIDAEWGLGMRMPDQMSFPKNLTLGAIQDLNLIYETGLEIGRQVRNFGAHLNLAPVVDVNNNPQNPIIHMRSFGQNEKAVAGHARALSSGMQDAGIFVCAKHFPGHGDTHMDSHKGLPSIEHALDRIHDIELYPFRKLFARGADCVMTAHLLFPELDSKPVSFSKKVVTDLLKNQLQYQGIVITDALNMKALSIQYSAEEIALLAHRAGHDLLLYGDHIAPNIEQILRAFIPRGYRAIKQAYLSGELSMQDLDAHVAKILAFKRKMSNHVYNDQYDYTNAKMLKRRLYEKAITLVRGRVYQLNKEEKILYLQLGAATKDRLSELLNGDCKHCETEEQLRELLASIHEYDHVIVSSSLGCNLDLKTVEKLVEVQDRVGLSFILFNSPYRLKGLDRLQNILVGYEADPVAYEVVFDMLCHRIIPEGILPVSY